MIVYVTRQLACLHDSDKPNLDWVICGGYINIAQRGGNSDKTPQLQKSKVLRRNEMFYLTTHSTHFIYCYMASYMVKDHSDSERGNLLLPHGLLFILTARVLLYASFHRCLISNV